jgi:hypothetical protein
VRGWIGQGLHAAWYNLALVCGNSSVVEHDLAKVGVAGSNPVSRSSTILFPPALLVTIFLAGCESCCSLPNFTFRESGPPQYRKCRDVMAPVTGPGQRSTVLRRECESTPSPRD